LPTPRHDEVRIRIRATTVTAGDCELRGLRFSFGLRLLVRMLMGPLRPRRKILGQEFAGEVEAVGTNVQLFKQGDRVFGTTGFRFGAYAEYICLPESSRDRALTTKPANMSYAEAAAVPTGGLEALHFLRKARSLDGKRVLIYGGGGGIGTYAVQLAKFYGAHVTGVDGPEKQDLMRALGADRVIDYTQGDLTPKGGTYDVIFDVVGKSPFSASLASLGVRGDYLLGNPRLSTMVRGLWTSKKGGKKVVFGAATQRSADLVFLRELIEQGKIRSVIDRQFPLEQIPAAHRYFETGHARGKVVISTEPSTGP